MYAPLQVGRVISQDPANHAVWVMFPSTQMPAISVKIGLRGAADAFRINHASLPSRGTYGVVGFLAGDNRSGVWLCSLYVQQMDALTTDSDPTLDYHSHWSGYYDLINENGDLAQSFPDGTFLVVSGAAVKPTMFRHIVDDQQNRQTIPLTDAQRVPNPPPAKHVYLSTASGTTVHIDPSGNVTIQAKTGTINLTAPNNINLGSLGETIYRLVDERMVALFNAHVHLSGGAGIPTTQMAIGSQTTTVTRAG
jgi:hypothetical protein